jgi:OST-HTH/LOTUS domain
VGIGVAGSSSKSLAAACDEFVIYDALPGVPVFEPSPVPAETETETETDAEAGTEAAAPPKKRRRAARPADNEEPEEPDPQATATGLLKRALQIGLEKDDADWLHNSAVKAQMKRMDPSFSEKSLGFRSFSDFLRSRSDTVELDESSTTRMVRLK